MKRSFEKSMTDMPPSDSTAKAVIRRSTKASYNKGNPAVIEATMTDDIVVHSLFVFVDSVHGINAYLEWMSDLLKAIPDTHAKIEMLVAEVDPAAVHWTVCKRLSSVIGQRPAKNSAWERSRPPDERGMREYLGLLERQNSKREHVYPPEICGDY